MHRTDPHDARKLPFIALGLEPTYAFKTYDFGAQLPPHPAPMPGSADGPPKVKNIYEKDGLEVVGTEDDQYTVFKPIEAFRRVLCYNPPTGDAFRRQRITKSRERHSLLGKYGHLERLNAWSHLMAALAFLAFFVCRCIFFKWSSTSSRLAGVASLAAVFVFSTSTVFHIWGTVGWLSYRLRSLDHGAIYLSFAVANLCDVSIVTKDLYNVPAQTVADPIIAALVLMLFFFYRRFILPPSETEVAWGECSLGLWRRQHSDSSWGALRSAGYAALSFSFLLSIPLAFKNLDYDLAEVLAACNGSALVVLVFALLLDNVAVWPDASYQDAFYLKKKSSLFLHSAKCGCIMSSHAIWHILSAFSIVILTTGREVVLWRS